jgi:hypothetical protein
MGYQKETEYIEAAEEINLILPLKVLMTLGSKLQAIFVMWERRAKDGYSAEAS